MTNIDTEDMRRRIAARKSASVLDAARNPVLAEVFQDVARANQSGDALDALAGTPRGPSVAILAQAILAQAILAQVVLVV